MTKNIERKSLTGHRRFLCCLWSFVENFWMAVMHCSSNILTKRKQPQHYVTRHLFLEETSPGIDNSSWSLLPQTCVVTQTSWHTFLVFRTCPKIRWGEVIEISVQKIRRLKSCQTNVLLTDFFIAFLEFRLFVFSRQVRVANQQLEC